MSTGRLIADSARPRIMLVEDDPAVRRSTQLVLQARGWDVRAHATAATLLADPAWPGAACLVADFRLADGDGIALLGVVRARGWDGPAILITGYNSPEITARAVDEGYARIIDKPLRGDGLAATVARLIARPSV